MPDYSVDVLFYENDLYNDPLFITTMITPPRLGESVAFPQSGQEFPFVGMVKAVGWSYEKEQWFCSIILGRI